MIVVIARPKAAAIQGGARDALDWLAKASFAPAALAMTSRHHITR